MGFYRIRKGRYRYYEERYREGKKVRSRSTYLGVVGATGFAQDPGESYEERQARGMHSAEIHAEASKRAYEKEKAEAVVAPAQNETPTPTADESAPPSTEANGSEI